MPSQDSTTARTFVARRAELHAIASRMLGSSADADDAVQETWLRLARTPDPSAIENPAGWLRTVLTRICLDALRARRSGRAHLTLDQPALDHLAAGTPEDHRSRVSDPAAQAVLADAVGRALLAVLDTLEPAERIAFVLHEMFAVSHREIAVILERTPTATKKLASRARLRLRGPEAAAHDQDLGSRRHVVGAFLAAARAGDLEAILAVLAPDVVRRADPAALPPGVPAELHGARPVAEGTVLLAGRAADADLVLVDGAPGLVVAPHGRVVIALTFTVRVGLVHAYEVIADPARLADLDLALMP